MNSPPSWMLCCDPGLVSGLAILHWSTGHHVGKIESIEGSLGEVGEAAEDFVRMHSPKFAEVVTERFVITPRTGELASPDWSLKVNGMLEWLVWKHWGLPGDETVIYQGASEAKRLCPNNVEGCGALAPRWRRTRTRRTPAWSVSLRHPVQDRRRVG